MNIAVLGSGFIGKYLNSYLSDNHLTYLLNQTDDQYHVSHRLREFIKTHKIDVVVNTCGYTGYPNVDACEDNKASCTLYNITVPLVIEEECKAANAKFINVSSGCIYTGYDKDYVEDDEPNFGIYNSDSSFYSKTKHLSEMFLDKDFTNIIRIRMPVTSKMDHKNLLSKLNKYDNIIDFKNSKTDVVKLCQFIEVVVENFKPGIYNAVHNKTLTTREVTEIMVEYGIQNDNWKFIPYEDLDIQANRSNCVLDNSKAKRDFDFDFGDEEYYIRLNCAILQKSESWQEKV
jgi:3,5-epimerase/4-reductase